MATEAERIAKGLTAAEVEHLVAIADSPYPVAYIGASRAAYALRAKHLIRSVPTDVATDAFEAPFLGRAVADAIRAESQQEKKDA